MLVMTYGSPCLKGSKRIAGFAAVFDGLEHQ